MRGKREWCQFWRADHDLLVVRELRALANERKKALRIAPRAAAEQLKWLQWPDFIMVGRTRLEPEPHDSPMPRITHGACRLLNGDMAWGWQLSWQRQISCS